MYVNTLVNKPVLLRSGKFPIREYTLAPKGFTKLIYCISFKPKAEPKTEDTQDE